MNAINGRECAIRLVGEPADLGRTSYSSERPPLRSTAFAAAAAMAIASVSSPAASASVSYTYDQAGRVTTAFYDNGVCVIYSYDAVGNRTSQTNSASPGPQTPTWATGTWGCFKWTALAATQVGPSSATARAFAGVTPEEYASPPIGGGASPGSVAAPSPKARAGAGTTQ